MNVTAMLFTKCNNLPQLANIFSIDLFRNNIYNYSKKFKFKKAKIIHIGSRNLLYLHFSVCKPLLQMERSLSPES